MVSPPTANPRTRSRWDSSKASTIKSASSRDGHMGYATKNISASRFSLACFRRYDPPKSPTRFPEDPKFFSLLGFIAEIPAIERDLHAVGPKIIEQACKIVQKKARAAIGKEHEMWAPLAESTIADKQHH